MAAGMVFRIVVGVDGSDSSLAALEWALEEARLRSREVYVVTAWHYPVIGDAVGRAEDHEAFGDNARSVYVDALRRASETGVTVTGEVTEGHPAEVLLKAAAGRICWWSDRVAMAASPGCSWDRYPAMPCTMPIARCWSSVPVRI